MKICKNCSSINKDDAVQCTTCTMYGMMVEQAKKKNNHETIKQIYHSCSNCGTSETGGDEKCKKCNFPLAKGSRNKNNNANPLKYNAS